MRSSAFFFLLVSLMLLAGEARTEPIDYKELLPFLNIDIPGWTPDTRTGQTVTSPVQASEAVLQFANGDQRLEVAIYDGGPALAAGMAAVAQTASESPEEVVKPVAVKGFKGAIFQHPKDNEADLVVMVPDRFEVSAHLDGSTDEEVLKNAISQIDLEKLAEIGRAGKTGGADQAGQDGKAPQPDQAGEGGQAGQDGKAGN
jgi:hypothetical protein